MELTKEYFDEQLNKMNRRMDLFATKEDIKGFATKEDIKGFATKEDLKNFATKDDLAKFATKEYIDAKLIYFATKNDLVNFATKSDIQSLEVNLKSYTDTKVAELKEHSEQETAKLIGIINETIAIPLQEHLEETSDYPQIRTEVKALNNDVRKIKSALHIK
jgi:hypothetical protein